MSINLSVLYWEVINEEEPMQYLSSLANAKAGVITAQKGRDKKEGEGILAFTILDIGNQ